MMLTFTGIGMEGIGCVLAGAFGSGSGTTSYSENIGAIGITKVYITSLSLPLSCSLHISLSLSLFSLSIFIYISELLIRSRLYMLIWRSNMLTFRTSSLTK